jgi:hypothetical protein
MITKKMYMKWIIKMIKIWLMSILLIAKSQMILLILICRSILISTKKYKIIMNKTISTLKLMISYSPIKNRYNQSKKENGLRRMMSS